MSFFDSSNFFRIYDQNKKIRDLRSEKAFYKSQKQEVIKDREELNTNKVLLEKFAREKYLMKRPGEDIYVIRSTDRNDD